jgi:hypothetical protein
VRFEVRQDLVLEARGQARTIAEGPEAKSTACVIQSARINSSVRMSPAMAARVTDRLWDIGDIVKLIEEWEAEQ